MRQWMAVLRTYRWLHFHYDSGTMQFVAWRLAVNYEVAPTGHAVAVLPEALNQRDPLG